MTVFSNCENTIACDNDSQPKNAYLSISMIECEIIICFKEMQFLNVHFIIDVNEDEERLTSDRDEQQLNAKLSI